MKVFEIMRGKGAMAAAGATVLLALVLSVQIMSLNHVPGMSHFAGLGAFVPESAVMYQNGAEPRDVLDRMAKTKLEGQQVALTARYRLSTQDSKRVSETLQKLAKRIGGSVLYSQSQKREIGNDISLQLSVPVSNFPHFQQNVAGKGVDIDEEIISAEDMTRKSIDLEARIRNLKAEEQQYLHILNQARKVQDVLDVTERLSDVRSEIETSSAEAETLARHVAMAFVEVQIYSAPEADIMGVNWRPIRQIKLSYREALSQLADYGNAVIGFVLELPVIALWMASLLALLWSGVTVILWAGKQVLPRWKAMLAR